MPEYIQQIMNPITPPASIDLTTLADVKTQLNITITTYDAALQDMITNYSAIMAKMVHRVFGYQQVDETLYDISNQERRLYFSQWPVKRTDIVSMQDQNGTDLLSDPSWVLEEATGTLYKPPENYWMGNVDVIYSGGYNLPSEAPHDLQWACIALVREGYFILTRGILLSGVRMIAHKQARIMYHTPTLQTLGSAGSPATWAAVQTTLNRYMRYWL
jgi:hypothetical protein